VTQTTRSRDLNNIAKYKYHNLISITYLSPSSFLIYMDPQKPTNNPTSISTIPPGYTIGNTPDGKQYLVPSYMVPALDQAFASYQKKINMGVANADPGVSHSLLIQLCAPQASDSRVYAGDYAAGPGISDHILTSYLSAIKQKIPHIPMYQRQRLPSPLTW
jgi:hypothetical protein